MSDELKPCPFCGAPADLIKGTFGYYVQCAGELCNAKLGDWVEVKYAIQAWNTRIIEKSTD